MAALKCVLICLSGAFSPKGSSSYLPAKSCAAIMAVLGQMFALKPTLHWLLAEDRLVWLPGFGEIWAIKLNTYSSPIE